MHTHGITRRSPLGPKPMSWDERLWNRIALQPDTRCCLWSGLLTDDGYGYFTAPPGWTGSRLVHRAVWQLLCGPIPDDRWLCHLCRNRHCCNPEHLYLGTTQENAWDRMRDGVNPPYVRLHPPKQQNERVEVHCIGCSMPFKVRPSTLAQGAGKFHNRVCYRAWLDTQDEARFWSHITKTPTCWFWMAARNPGGYGMFSLRSTDRKATYMIASRYSWILKNGEIPDGLFVCHKCDVRHCVNPDHLFLGDIGDNNRDAALKGRTASGDRNGWRTKPEAMLLGERHPQAKLTVADVRDMRARYKPRVVTYEALAKEKGVSMQVAWDVINRRTWQHVE